MKVQLGILGSGTGSNMAAIADACRSGFVNAEVAIVISDVKNAPILQLAKDRQIPNFFLENEAQFISILKEYSVDWVILAGFMRILKRRFLQSFPNRIINIHPSLLPDFRGNDAPRRALESGRNESGTTVHFVDEGIDTGQIIDRAIVKIFENDTVQTLHSRIKKAEHKLYPEVIAKLISD